MKKKNFLLVVVVVFIILELFGCSSGKRTTTNEAINKSEKKVVKNNEKESRNFIMSNHIMEVDRIEFLMNPDNKPVHGNKLTTVIYDSSGLMKETDSFNSEGKLLYKYLYDFNPNGKRIKTIRYNSKGDTDKYYNYEYDKNGNKIKSVRFNANGKPDETYIYKYDDEGNLIEELWYDANKNLEYKIEYENNNGRKTSYRTYNSKGDLISKYNFNYNNQCKIIEQERYDADGDKVGVIQYVYKYY
jgi:hypothetical protein